jgi:hypothetical protein
VAEDHRRERGLLETSVIIDLETLDPSQLPDVAIRAVRMPELAASNGTRSAEFDPLRLDGNAARIYERIFASLRPDARRAEPGTVTRTPVILES